MTAKETWKPVTIGGLTGILMGAGAIYGVQAYAQRNDDVTVVNPEEGIRVGSVNDGMSFAKAFEAARAEVGPGGVFTWHGNIYNTYTVDEWEALTDSEKLRFTNQVKPEVSAADLNAHQLSGSVNDGEDVQIVHHGLSEDATLTNTSSNSTEETSASQRDTHQTEDDFGVDDVRIVGYGNVDGHLAISCDINSDGNADVAIIDVDDSHTLSPQDVIFDREGNHATLGELDNSNGYSGEMAQLENPDVAPDMPDYMNEVLG